MTTYNNVGLAILGTLDSRDTKLMETLMGKLVHQSNKQTKNEIH